MRIPSRAHHPEAGYALLYVYAMGAMIAIGLYEQLPRAAFEAQREKEQLLINHGEQYRRGVQLYVRKMGRYPAQLADLDNTQNIRFLRKHYFDPMTGKEEWRLLHMGPNGKLIDSKIESKDAAQDQWHAGSITEFKSAGSADVGGPENANIATRKRPSDDQINLGAMPGTTPIDPNMVPSSGTPASLAAGIAPPGGGMPAPTAGTNPNGPSGGAGAAGAPAWLNGGALPGMPAGQRGMTANLNATTQNGAQALAAASANGQASVSGNGGFGSSISGNGGFGSPSGGSSPPTPTYGQPVSSNFGGQSPSPYPTAAGSNMNPNTGFGQPGNGANAANLINGLLTQPRPGGPPGQINNGSSFGTVVGGFAGVASTYKGHSVIHYNDQDDYSKWEFFYDMGAEQAAAQQNQMRQMQPPANTQQQNQPSGGGSFGQQQQNLSSAPTQ